MTLVTTDSVGGHGDPQTYGAVVALKNASLAGAPARSTRSGANGAGKSTLARS